MTTPFKIKEEQNPNTLLCTKLGTWHSSRDLKEGGSKALDIPEKQRNKWGKIKQDRYKVTVEL